MRANGRITLETFTEQPRYNPETSRYEEVVTNEVTAPCFVSTVAPSRLSEVFGDVEKTVINVNLLNHLTINNSTHIHVDCPELNISTNNCKLLKTTILRNNKQVIYLEVIK